MESQQGYIPLPHRRTLATYEASTTHGLFHQHASHKWEAAISYRKVLERTISDRTHFAKLKCEEDEEWVYRKPFMYKWMPGDEVEFAIPVRKCPLNSSK